jgi:hypothetical protein
MPPAIRIVVVVVGLAAFVICGAHTVWPPDLASPRVHVLGSATATTGDRFQVVQYWNRGDMYTTELEHLAPDGTFTVTQIDWDDAKQWFSRIRLREQEKKASVTFPLRSTTWEYDWRARRFAAPYDSREVHLVLHTSPRSSFSKPGDSITRTDSWLTEAGRRAAAEMQAHQ